MKSLKVETPRATICCISAQRLKVGAEVGDRHVQRVVDAGFAHGLGVPGGERLGQRMPARLQGEVDDGRRAADGRGARAGQVIVRGCGPAEGHVEVRVDVDAARHDEQAGGVDKGVAGKGELGTHSADLLALDEDVSLDG